MLKILAKRLDLALLYPVHVVLWTAHVSFWCFVLGASTANRGYGSPRPAIIINYPLEYKPAGSPEVRTYNNPRT